MKTEIVKFAPQDVDKVWVLVKDLVQTACDRAGHFCNAEHIREILLNAKMQLWVIWEVETKKVLCVVVTELRQFPNYKICDIRITAGRGMKTWFHFVDTIMKWAKAQGCKKIQALGRSGWKKMLKSRGFEQTHIMVEKEL